MMTEQIRNKYNTLTPAEAKKLNRMVQGSRQPLRTASVLRKPRAPPIVVTNLDNDVEKQLIGSIDSSKISQQRQSHTQLPSQISPHESFSNLSFRSTRDMPDYTPYDPTYRFQTMSVDIAHPNNNQQQQQQQQMRTATINRAYDTMRGRVKYAAQRSSTLNYRFSDESFSSAKSELSNISNSLTPTKFNIKTAFREPSRSASKVSLSSSTYKVFQSPIANFKKLFRGFHKPVAQATSIVDHKYPSQRDVGLAKSSRQQNHHQPEQQQCDRSLNEFSMSDSISRLSLNKSQSPPVCPPPPGELKSMSYLENSYSNYDEFTRARNERLPRSSPMTGGDSINQAPVTQACNYRPITIMNDTTLQAQQNYDTVANDENDNNSNWQMTSLPVYYERNLTTVFEEKQASCELSGSNKAQYATNLANMNTEEIYQRIKPPIRFDDPNNQQQQQQHQQQQQQQQRVESEPSESCERPQSVASSSHSPALSITAESVLEYHRQQPATPYRFSFAQPLLESDQASLGRNLGLPPRTPVGAQQTATNISESQRQDTSSSGNSSNCSSQINGINHCDKRNPTDSSLSNTPVTVSNAIRRLSHSISDSGGYGNVSGLNIDADATILSETSTIEGDSGATFYANKCGELERTVVTLKNKVLNKEKELTDLQLSQLNNDYTIERLRKQVSKLERENAQLKAIVVTRNGNSVSNSAAMDRIHV